MEEAEAVARAVAVIDPIVVGGVGKGHCQVLHGTGHREGGTVDARLTQEDGILW